VLNRCARCIAAAGALLLMAACSSNGTQRSAGGILLLEVPSEQAQGEKPHEVAGRMKVGERLEVLLRMFTANPAQQGHLEACAQTTGPLLRIEWCLARNHCLRLGLAIGRQIQHQQGAFRKQRATSHRAQIIEQRQQY
jgi:hypothetical protein